MSRGYQPEDHLNPRGSSGERGADAGDRPIPDELREQASHDGPPSPAHEPDRTSSRSAEPRTVYELRGRTYRLRTPEVATMVELGKFRVVAGKDLAEFIY